MSINWKDAYWMKKVFIDRKCAHWMKKCLSKNEKPQLFSVFKCILDINLCSHIMGIYKIGCNIYAKKCLLAENVHIGQKCVYWMKMYLPKGVF